MNENQNPAWALELDTPDLLEALAIAAVSYANWRDANAEVYRANPRHPSTLHHVAGDRFLQRPGFWEEPQAAFNGKAMTISRVAAYAIGIDRPLSPLLRCLWYRAVEQDGEDTPRTIGEFAEYLVEYITSENDERNGSAAA